MPHPAWNSGHRDSIDALSFLPEGLRSLLGPDDDRTEVADVVERLRFAGFDVLTPDVFAFAVSQARATQSRPAPELPVLYKAGEWQRRQQARSVVYYARVGNRVKIGYTTDVRRRMATLHAEELLATEPGGPELEARRHKEFADLHSVGEWFHLDGPLVAHIASLAG